MVSVQVNFVLFQWFIISANVVTSDILLLDNTKNSFSFCSHLLFRRSGNMSDIISKRIKHVVFETKHIYIFFSINISVHWLTSNETSYLFNININIHSIGSNPSTKQWNSFLKSHPVIKINHDFTKIPHAFIQFH